MIPFRLAIVVTHPIQYYAPLFKLMALDHTIELKVFYTLGIDLNVEDKGFGKSISWDIPLLDGYEYEFLENNANDKGSHHFKGISNPQATLRIDHFGPDAILIYGWAYQSHLALIKHYAHRTPIWFRGDSTLLDEKGLIKPLLKRIFLKWVYKKIRLAFYTGTNNKAYFKHYGVKEEQLIFAPHAIDNERFGVNKEAEATAFRESLAVGEDDILILFAGKFEEKKDPVLLLDAFIELQKPNVHLLFVGNGLLEKKLKLKVERSKISIPNIHFLDFQNQRQMPVVYQACDLFCLPSKGPAETWGLAVNEAMATGKAILLSNKVGCAVDLVEVQKNGSIFIAGDIADFKSKIEKLTVSRATLKKMGQYSAERIKNWSLQEQSARIIKSINLEK